MGPQVSSIIYKTGQAHYLAAIFIPKITLPDSLQLKQDFDKNYAKSKDSLTTKWPAIAKKILTFAKPKMSDIIEQLQDDDMDIENSESWNTLSLNQPIITFCPFKTRWRSLPALFLHPPLLHNAGEEGDQS